MSKNLNKIKELYKSLGDENFQNQLLRNLHLLFLDIGTYGILSNQYNYIDGVEYIKIIHHYPNYFIDIYTKEEDGSTTILTFFNDDSFQILNVGEVTNYQKVYEEIFRTHKKYYRDQRLNNLLK